MYYINNEYGQHLNAISKKLMRYDKNIHMSVGAMKGTFRRDIKMIVNHDYIKQCIIFAKKFFG